MWTQFKAASLSLVGALALVGCGGDQLGDKVKLELNERTAKAEFELSDGLEIALAGSFPILEGKGAVVLSPATRRDNAKVALEVDLETILDEELGGLSPVTQLPNGSPLPAAVLPPLLNVPVVQDGAVKVNAAFSLVPELQVGAMIEIKQFKSRYFPQGVSICQNFRNEQGFSFAAVCLYGPSADGKSGGVFVAATFGDVLNILEPNEEPLPMAENSIMPAGRMALASSALTVPDPEMSCMAMGICPKPQPRIEVKERFKSTSYEWREERYDPRRKLRGSKGYRALRNAKVILRAR